MSQSCPICNSNGIVIHQNVMDYYFGHEGEWDFFRCCNVDCALVWIHPQPMSHELQKFYGNYYTHDASGIKRKLKALAISIIAPAIIAPVNYHGWKKYLRWATEKLHPSLIADTLYGLGATAPFGYKRLLDIGCGNGERLPLLRQMGWSLAAGIDLDAKAVNTAQKLGRNVQIGSMDSIPYESGYFDFIFLHHVVEHVYDLRVGLRECFRVLREGGEIFILTPNADSRLHQHDSKYWRGLEAPRHLKIYTMGSLKKCLHETGFITQSLLTIDRSHKWISQQGEEVFSRLNILPTKTAIPELSPSNGEELLGIATRSKHANK